LIFQGFFHCDVHETQYAAYYNAPNLNTYSGGNETSAFLCP